MLAKSPSSKSPVAIITNPLPDKVVVPGGLLVFLGTANDMEDGTLPDGALRWTSDRQGELGFGPSLLLATLEYGEHISRRAQQGKGFPLPRRGRGRKGEG